MRDTTGAGDAFNGALGARLAMGDALADAVAYAVAAAGTAVATLGARAPLDPAEVERALRGG